MEKGSESNEIGGGSVLVVDDDVEFRRLLRSWLVTSGYDVTETSDPAEALEFVGRELFRVVLTAFPLPGANGVEFLRSIRERDLDIPMIVMTDTPDVATATAVLEHGALLYLNKPIRAVQLMSLIERALRARTPTSSDSSAGRG